MLAERRVAVFRESLAVLRQLLTGQAVTYRGRFFQLQGVMVRPAAEIPIYIGGRAEGALRRAGELADGWIMGPFGTVQEFKYAWRIVQEAARAAGKEPDALVLSGSSLPLQDATQHHLALEEFRIRSHASRTAIACTSTNISGRASEWTVMSALPGKPRVKYCLRIATNSSP
jgi:alkanesulfonate monooxygenase SsuD/methylene tetrahydromethanopterin reductase-like flavin-dependent oxidoreductase (luciferase family)